MGWFLIRVFTVDLGDFSPVQSAIPAWPKHMAVMKDFTIVGGTNVSGSAPSITTQTARLSVVQSSNATFRSPPTALRRWPVSGCLAERTFLTPSPTVTLSPIPNRRTPEIILSSSRIFTAASPVPSRADHRHFACHHDESVRPIRHSGQPREFFRERIGIQPLSCQWRFNGTNISARRQIPIHSANAQLTNAGNYSVLVTNVAGASRAPWPRHRDLRFNRHRGHTGGWDMSGSSNYGSSPMPATTNVPILTVGGLTRGSGVTTTQHRDHTSVGRK